MKISYNWIQEHIKEKLPLPQEVADTIHQHAFEIEGMEAVGEDTIFDIAVLPDRAGDCLSHHGMAREVVGLLRLTLKEEKETILPAIDQKVPVQLESDLCRRYIAVRIDGLKVGPSPEWLRTKLESIGQKSINNVVDATNFVLFDAGQPVHAFDAAKVDGGIVVRLAHEGETIKLLGAKEESSEKVLKETDLVIADYLGAIAIAGVKGGAGAEVTEATTSVIIEVANFDPVAVRKTSRRLSLITDASKRFENNFSPLVALPATEQVVALILELAGGTVSAVTDENKMLVEERVVHFSAPDITRLLGNTITATTIEDVLARYRYTFSKEGEKFTLTVPHWRADIMGAHDIAEEVGRVVGYDTIPALPLPFIPLIEPNAADLQITAVRAWCIAERYREVYTYTFCPKGEVSVAYGAKGKDKLRSALSDGLKESFELNRLNAPLLGLSEIKLFEIGTVFFADRSASAKGSGGTREEVHVALCDKGTIQELPLADFIKEKNIDVSIQLPNTYHLEPIAFRPWSSYPFVTRDIAVWLDSPEAKAKFVEAANTFALQHCARPPQLFDEFLKDGRTSVAYRFVFQASDRTLTDEEVATTFDTLLQAILAIKGAEIR